MGNTCVSGDSRQDSSLEGVNMKPTSKKCTKNKHIGLQDYNNSLCADKACKESVCKNCGSMFENELYCKDCVVFLKRQKARESGQIQNNRNSQVTEIMVKTSGLTHDKETGEIKGDWESLFASAMNGSEKVYWLPEEQPE